jgi:hypothetical protein
LLGPSRIRQASGEEEEFKRDGWPGNSGVPYPIRVMKEIRFKKARIEVDSSGGRRLRSFDIVRLGDEEPLSLYFFRGSEEEPSIAIELGGKDALMLAEELIFSAKLGGSLSVQQRILEQTYPHGIPAVRVPDKAVTADGTIVPLGGYRKPPKV